MALTDEQRLRVWRVFMRRNTEAAAFTKPQLRAGLNATDDWVEANAVEFNQALPPAFRSAATGPQKTLLLCLVAMERAGLLREDP
ncbi:hypothetical protein ACIBEJ_34980 [Nonomuraea sp. NPDC050790]|uniref:hypothetical protein n=1 Tax=Nonomuraea sp. NPDC050790 TaxID=3364371 RepID=UPI003787B5AF